jgi:hypothetical protein
VVTEISIWSSLAKCSAANVGPKRSPTSPEYFCRIKPSTFLLIFFGLARLELPPALPCTNPAAPLLW